MLLLPTERSGRGKLGWRATDVGSDCNERSGEVRRRSKRSLPPRRRLQPWTSRLAPASSSTTTTTTRCCCRHLRAGPGRGWSREKRRLRRRLQRRLPLAVLQQGRPRPLQRGLNTASRASCISCSTSGAASRPSEPSGKPSERNCR